MKLDKHSVINTLLINKPEISKFGISQIGLFGSYARNEQNEKSDIDILYDFKSTYSLFDLITLEENLYEQLHKKVDLVSLKNIKPYFKKYIVDDLIYLLNEKNEQIIS